MQITQLTSKQNSNLKYNNLVWTPSNQPHKHLLLNVNLKKEKHLDHLISTMHQPHLMVNYIKPYNQKSSNNLNPCTSDLCPGTIYHKGGGRKRLMGIEYYGRGWSIIFEYQLKNKERKKITSKIRSVQIGIRCYP